MGKIMYKDHQYSSFSPAAVIDLIYPIGSYYETSEPTFDPNTSWTGTWENVTRDAYSASGSATVNANTYYDLATLTLPGNTKYLVFGNIYSSTGTSQVQIAHFRIASGDLNTYTFYDGRTTAQAGGGTHTIGYLDVGEGDLRLVLQCYGYNTSSHTETGKIMAIPIDRAPGKYTWYRVG